MGKGAGQEGTTKGFREYVFSDFDGQTASRSEPLVFTRMLHAELEQVIHERVLVLMNAPQELLVIGEGKTHHAWVRQRVLAGL